MATQWVESLKIVHPRMTNVVLKGNSIVITLTTFTCLLNASIPNRNHKINGVLLLEVQNLQWILKDYFYS